MASYQTTHKLSACERRDSILSAATRLFAEKGFRGTTTREIASAVGVSEPVLYEHFETKHAIYTAVLDRMSASALAALDRRMRSCSEHVDTAAFLRETAAAIIDWFRKEAANVRLLFFSALEGEEASRMYHSRLIGRAIDALSAFISERHSHGIDSQAMAHAYVCMLGHHALLRTIFDHQAPKSDEQVIDDMVHIFIRGIGK